MRKIEFMVHMSFNNASMYKNGMFLMLIDVINTRFPLKLWLSTDNAYTNHVRLLIRLVILQTYSHHALSKEKSNVLPIL